jgi:2-polyprenyl-6-methoxyphenol hydroxylase-like FAD-dependent oxidoreductase
MLHELFAHTNAADLHQVYAVRTVDPSSEWGSDVRRRIILLGDAAHAVRPASGIGGSLAFEDAVIFCREMDRIHHRLVGSLKTTSKSSAAKDDDNNDPSTLIAQAIQRTVAIRQPRVKKVWQTEWDLAESFYQNNTAVVRPSPEYMAWLHAGV